MTEGRCWLHDLRPQDLDPQGFTWNLPRRLALVLRAFLCGEDRLTGRSFEHRRRWVENRIRELAGIFGVSVWGCAVMSDHLHVVVQILPEVVWRWSNAEIVERWTRLYPRQDQNWEMRVEVLAGNAERIEVFRERLSSLPAHSPGRNSFQRG